MKPSLAIIGASYLQKPLVLKAEELGFETHVFAWEEGAVCKPLADYFYPISTNDVAGIMHVCRTINPKGIVSISSDLASITTNQVADKLDLIGNSLVCTELTTNKFLMRERLRDRSLPCPLYWQVLTQDAVPAFEKSDFPLIVKPVDRSGSRGVTLAWDNHEIKLAVQVALKESFSSEVIIEQFIEGRELSVEAISWMGKHYILQFTDKETTGEPHFIERAHHQPADLDLDLQERIAQIVQNSLTALGIEYGASHTELKINSLGEIYIIEVGARMGGDFIGSHLVELSTGYDYLKGVIEVATGSFVEPLFTWCKHCGVHYVFPEAGILEAVIFKGDSYVVDHDIFLRNGDQVLNIVDSSMRPGYYIYQGTRRMEYDPEQLMIHTITG